MHINCHTHNGEQYYFPAEIAALEFNLLNGVSRTYHQIIGLCKYLTYCSSAERSLSIILFYNTRHAMTACKHFVMDRIDFSETNKNIIKSRPNFKIIGTYIYLFFNNLRGNFIKKSLIIT